MKTKSKRAEAKAGRKVSAKAGPKEPPTLDVEIAQAIRDRMTPHQQRETRDMLLRLISDGGIGFREGPSDRQLEDDARWFSAAIHWHAKDFGGRDMTSPFPKPPRKLNRKEAARAKKRLEDLRMVAARGIEAPAITTTDVHAKLSFMERATWLLMPEQVAEILDVRDHIHRISADLYKMLKLQDQRARVPLARKAA